MIPSGRTMDVFSTKARLALHAGEGDSEVILAACDEELQKIALDAGGLLRGFRTLVGRSANPTAAARLAQGTAESASQAVSGPGVARLRQATGTAAPAAPQLNLQQGPMPATTAAPRASAPAPAPNYGEMSPQQIGAQRLQQGIAGGKQAPPPAPAAPAQTAMQQMLARGQGAATKGREWFSSLTDEQRRNLGVGAGVAGVGATGIGLGATLGGGGENTVVYH